MYIYLHLTWIHVTSHLHPGPENRFIHGFIQAPSQTHQGLKMCNSHSHRSWLISIQVLTPSMFHLNSLQNKIWNLPDRSPILRKFIYDKRRKACQILPDRPKFCRSMSAVRHLFWRLSQASIQVHRSPSHFHQGCIWILTFGNRCLSTIAGERQRSRLAGWAQLSVEAALGPHRVPPSPPWADRWEYRWCGKFTWIAAL